MAITRMGHIKDAGNGMNGVARVIKYITNPDKCEGGRLVGTHNILLRGENVSDTAIRQIINTKQLNEKTDGRQMYHFKVSFAGNDNVTPELAKQIAKEFCETYLQDYEAVYAVHTNTKYLHFHVAFNSVSFVTGLKYHYAKGDWKKELQPVVNAICRKYGLSEIDVNTKSKNHNKSYNRWLQDHPERMKSTIKEYGYARIRADLDACIHKAKSYPDFLMLLRGKGYQVDDSKKHLRIFAPGRERPVRAYILTPDHATYTKENIRRMIAGNFTGNDRCKVLERMYRDWNIFVGTKRTTVILVRRKNNLPFAQHEEAMRLILVQGFKSIDDVKEFRLYLEQADRELNAIKKYVRSHIEYFLIYEEDMTTVLAYLKESGQRVHALRAGEQGQDDRNAAYEAMLRLEDAGVDVNRLYKLFEKSEQIMERIDGFKKKIFVDKKMTERIIWQEKKKDGQQPVPAVIMQPEAERTATEEKDRRLRHE